MKTIEEWYQSQNLTQGDKKQLFLTEAQVRSFPLFLDKPEEEIQEIIKTFHALSIITYELFASEVSENESIMLAA